MKLLLASLTPFLLTALMQVTPTSQPESGADESAKPASAQTAPAIRTAPRFTSIDIYMDTDHEPLAAYQFELIATGADVQIVGVEGGEHAAFREPPYYDPAALSHNRIIIAAFNTGRDLPTGKTRVARLHLRINGAEPTYTTRLDAAGSINGAAINPTISVDRSSPSARAD